MIACITLCGQLVSCDVHEFPDKHPFVIHLKYDTVIPLYKTIEFDSPTRSNMSEIYDVRYIVEVYGFDADDDSLPIERFVFTKDDISVLDNSLRIRLKKGKYRFVVWSDYVKQGSDDDHLYSTASFDNISLSGDTYVGNTDIKDAFEGRIDSEVSKTINEVTIEMCRPVGKFKFISTDVEEFISHILTVKGLDKSQIDAINKGNLSDNQSKSLVNFDDYKVVFRYNGYIPTNYNIFTSKPIDSDLGLNFSSQVTQISDTEAELGFDYIFVNSSESTICVSVEIYDAEDELIAGFNPVNVPIVRGKLTLVKAKFLTSDLAGGVSVIPDYDGEYNFLID